MAKILITGSNGFIGKELVKRFKKDEYITDIINSERIDFKNLDQVLKLESVEIVIHLGSKTKKNLEWQEYYENNVLGTLNILKYCVKKKIKKIIFLSSYVYGNPKYLPIDEKHPINPHNKYTKSKYLAEELCRTYAKKFNINTIILRPFNIYGEKLPEGFLISNLLKSIKNDEKITITNKLSKRDFLHVNDFIDLILKLMNYNCELEIFNVGSGKSYSFTEIIENIENKITKKIDIKYIENQENFIEDIKADITKICKIVDWKPKRKFYEELEQIIKTK